MKIVLCRILFWIVAVILIIGTVDLVTTPMLVKNEMIAKQEVLGLRVNQNIYDTSNMVVSNIFAVYFIYIVIVALGLSVSIRIDSYVFKKRLTSNRYYRYRSYRLC